MSQTGIAYPEANMNQAGEAKMEGLASLLQWSTSFFDWLVTQYVTGQYAERLTAQIRTEREFDLTKKNKTAYVTPEEIAANAEAFFGKPFSGALVAWNVYTDIVEEVIPLVTYDPMVLLGYADFGQATGFEEKSTLRVPSPLKCVLAEALNPVATIEKVACEQCCTRYYLLSMATVLLAGTDPSYWRIVADQTKDLRGPCLVDQFIEYVTPKPSKIF
ncbi:MAG TPA: hypothetical protein VE129_00750 [Thermoanaerobaculia bacterium]|nr:hypothetical protein [Thermoanaerobaculia bacterium]